MGPRPRLSSVLAGVGPWTYLLNQPPILVRYLRLTVWPQSLVLLYGWPREVTLNDVLPSAIVIVALLILTIVGLRFRPQLAFLGAWCWIILAPTSTIVPMVTEVGAERRMYLPLAGLVVLFVVGAALIWDKLRIKLPTRMQSSRSQSIGAAFLLVAISASLAAATVVRNREYSSPLEMAETILDRYPTPLAHQLMGTTLLEVGRRDEAMTHLRQALPDIPRAHYFIGVELLNEGKVDEGIVELQAFVRGQPPYLADVVDARGHLGTAFAQQERWPEAISEFVTILELVPGNPMTELLLADALFSAGRWNESIVHYRAYLDSDPNDAGALNNVGVALASNGNVDDAPGFFQRALAIDGTFGAAERNLASALAAKRDFEQALGHAQRAVTLQPDDAVSHYVLGLVLKGQAKRVEARAEFARAIELEPALDAARQSLQELQ
jgi:tetratricopeptide (TPR) repeat protein